MFDCLSVFVLRLQNVIGEELAQFTVGHSEAFILRGKAQEYPPDNTTSPQFFS